MIIRELRGAGFQSASAEELVIIETYLDEMNDQALDYVWNWVHGIWAPDSAYPDMDHIQYFIKWLGTEGKMNLRKVNLAGTGHSLETSRRVTPWISSILPSSESKPVRRWTRFESGGVGTLGFESSAFRMYRAIQKAVTEMGARGVPEETAINMATLAKYMTEHGQPIMVVTKNPESREVKVIYSRQYDWSVHGG